MKSADLFPEAPVPKRAKPRVMMHFTDVGHIDGIGQAATFECSKCGSESGWIGVTNTEVRRGIPCEKCNKSDIKLTSAQQKCLEKLRQVKSDDGWILNHGENIGYQIRVLDALVSFGLVERDRGCYRAVVTGD